MMYKGGYEFMVCWMLKEFMFKLDRFFVDGIRNRLFENLNVIFLIGEMLFLDLGVFNI